ncbi:MAG: hypothetical protein ACYC3N_06185 [Halothiobacillus sp.]
MSAAPADSTNNNAMTDPHVEASAVTSFDPLVGKIDELISLCRVLDQHRREYRDTAERLADDNAKLRRILLHTHQQIQQLADHIRQMEE